MIPVTNAAIDIGKTDHRAFSEAGVGPNDWQFLTVTVDSWFQPSSDANVRVIVTPNNRSHDDVTHVAAPVVIVSPFANGAFDIAARNVDCTDGEAGFNWMVVVEETLQDVPVVDFRIGVAQPQVLEASCTKGDWVGWNQRYSSPIHAEPKEVVGLLTGGYIGPTAWRNLVWDQHNVPKQAAILPTTVQYADNPVAAQPIACDEAVTSTSPSTALSFMARNTDDFRGTAAVNWMASAFAERRNPAVADMVVDSGRASAQYIKVAPNGDAWQYWEVQFHRPFDSPPVVLLTTTPAADTWASSLDQNAVPLVGQVLNVTRFGFTLAARNSDVNPGQAGFFWVALGCSIACG